MPKAQVTLQVWYYCHIVVKIVLKSHFGTFMTLRYFTSYLVNFQYCIKNKVQGNILRDCKYVSDMETYMDNFTEEVVKILDFLAICLFLTSLFKKSISSKICSIQRLILSKRHFT